MPENEEFDSDRLMDEVEVETDAELTSRISKLTGGKREKIVCFRYIRHQA